MHEAYYSTTGYPNFMHTSHPHHGYRPRARSPSSSMGRSTPDSEDYCHQESTFKMRWILSLGLLLPALAAVIGVVAWAVSAEVVMGARRASALRASEAAFHFSQGPRELEWHSLMDAAAARPPGPTDGRDDYDENVLDATTLSSLTSSTVATTLKDQSSPMPSSTTTTTTTEVTTTTGAAKSSTREAPIVTSSSVTSTKRPVFTPSTSSSLVTFSPGKSDKNVTNIFFLNGDMSKSSDTRDDKKSPGDQVAAVINQLVASRNYKGSTRPQIVVVAPLPDKKKKTLSSGSSSFSITTVTATPSTSTPPTTSGPTVTTTRQAKSKSSSLKMSRARSTTTTSTSTTTTTTTTTEEPELTTIVEPTTRPRAILSRDADTLMAAAQMLAARHKIMRSDNDEDEEGGHEMQTISPKLYQEFQLTTERPSPGQQVNRISYQHFPPPRSVYDLPRPSLPRQDVSGQSPPHHHHHHFHHQLQRDDVPPQSPHQAPPSPNHVNHNYNEQMMSPGGRDAERVGAVPLSHYMPGQLQAGAGRNYVPPPPPPHAPQPSGQMQIRLQPPRHYAPQSEPVFMGQMMPPQVASSFIQPNIMKYGHMHQPPPPPHMRHQFASPVLLQAIQLPQQQQQASSTAVTGPYPQPQQQQQMQHATPPSNYMVTGMESSASSVNPEAADESQVISNSAVTSSGDQNSANSNAMVSIHANDPQAAASSKGLTLHFGGGPKQGSSQLMTSPVGIFKTMLLPLFPKPRLNLNGKVVFGVVLDSHINKKKSIHPLHA